MRLFNWALSQAFPGSFQGIARVIGYSETLETPYGGPSNLEWTDEDLLHFYLILLPVFGFKNTIDSLSSFIFRGSDCKLITSFIFRMVVVSLYPNKFDVVQFIDV